MLSSEKRQLHLEEYKTNEYWIRHRDRQYWTITSLFLGANGVALSLVLRLPGEGTLAHGGRFILTVIAVVLAISILMWLRIIWREMEYHRIVYRRQRELESVLGFGRNLSIHRSDQQNCDRGKFPKCI